MLHIVTFLQGGGADQSYARSCPNPAHLTLLTGEGILVPDINSAFWVPRGGWYHPILVLPKQSQNTLALQRHWMGLLLLPLPQPVGSAGLATQVRPIDPGGPKLVRLGLEKGAQPKSVMCFLSCSRKASNPSSVGESVNSEPY